MPTKSTMTGLHLQAPLTPRQEELWAALNHEQIVAHALGAACAAHAHDMDTDRVRDTMPMARRISELRCAGLRAELVREEVRKARRDPA